MRTRWRSFLSVPLFGSIIGCSDSSLRGAEPAPTGREGKACLPDGTCVDGLRCLAGVCAVVRGTLTDPCYSDGSCEPGLVCQDGVCVHPHGGIGQLCYGNGNCDEPLVCRNGWCDIPRGALGQACYPTDICDDGLTCLEDQCVAELLPPADLIAIPQPYDIRLVWQHPQATDFEVWRSDPADAGPVRVASSTAGQTEYVDADILLGRTYGYSVRAMAGELQSAQSEAATASALTPPADWTLIYFLSSDGDYDYTYWFNVEEMQRQGGSSDRVHVLALYDGYPQGDSRYYRVGNSSATTEMFDIPNAVGGEVNMGDASTYTDFVDWMLPRFTARHYLVSFHDHGGGAIQPVSKRSRSIGPQNMLYDQTSSDSLDPNEQGLLISYLADQAQQPVDVVDSMVCLGQMVETAYPMAGHARYHVAAESVSYVTLTFPIEYLAEHPNATSLDVAQFLLEHHAAGIEAQDVPCHWSLVDLEHVPPLADALEALAHALGEFASGQDQQALIRQTVARAQCFFIEPGDRMSAYVDIRDMAEKLLDTPELPPAVHTAAQGVVDAFDAGMVLANFQRGGVHPGTTLEVDYSHAHGLSIYHPNELFPDCVEANPPYKELTFAADTGWGPYTAKLCLVP